MRRVIDRLAFDTDNATLLGAWWNGHPIEESPLWETQKLYMKPTGEFFIVCNGGELIKRDRKDEWEDQGNYHGWVIPLEDEDQAVNWAIDHLSIRDVESIFGKFPESRDRSDGWNYIPSIPFIDLPPLDDDETEPPLDEEEKKEEEDNEFPEEGEDDSDTDFEFF